MQARTGLLIITSLSKLSNSLIEARKYVLNKLYIQLYTPYRPVQPPAKYHRTISNIYLTSLVNCSDIEVRIITSNLKTRYNYEKFPKSIDLLISDKTLSSEENNLFTTCYSIADKQIIRLDKCTDEDRPLTKDPSDSLLMSFQSDNSSQSKSYDHVVVGGTFDRLHIGHKILLTEAVLRTTKRLVVGVTDQNMIKSKKLCELILPVQQRINEVMDFLQDIDSTLEYEVVPISDLFGPTKTDPFLELIIVSSETLRGGEKVNELRKNNNLNPLDIYCIELIETNEELQDKEIKISSSNQRMDLLGTRLKEPEPRPNLPSYNPYIIGLMGGIASGKSVMIKRFQEFGAKIIDCDKMAHELYEIDKKCYLEIVKEFGTDILNDNKLINRQKLGEIVFADTEKLNLLNNIIWPELLISVKKRIQQLHEENRNQEHSIIIIEAAILLKANWINECHEIWSLILPPEEAVKRLRLRNGLDEESAKQRISAQVDNETIVKHSNVVFSTLWSHEYSQIQAVKRLRLRNGLDEESAKQRISAQVDNETIVKHSNVVFSTLWSHEYSQIQAEKAWKTLMNYLNELKVKSKM